MANYTLCLTAGYAKRDTGVFEENTIAALKRFWRVGAQKIDSDNGRPTIKNTNHPNGPDTVDCEVELSGWPAAATVSKITIVVAQGKAHLGVGQARRATPFAKCLLPFTNLTANGTKYTTTPALNAGPDGSKAHCSY